MRLSSIELLYYLRNRPTMPLLYFVETELPLYAGRLRNPRLVYSRWGSSAGGAHDGFRKGNWLEDKFWHNRIPGELTGFSDATAVFACDYKQIPHAAFDFLARRGIERAIYRSGDKWYAVEVKRAYKIAIEKAQRKLLRTFGLPLIRLDSFIQKLILKYSAVNLQQCGVKGFIHNGGCCFIAHVPQLRQYADADGHTSRDILLFEERILLNAHQQHDDIRSFGRGRYSHWEEAFYFSSSDNSDPNFNGRRYRLVLLKGWRKLLRPYFAVRSRFGSAKALELKFSRVGRPLISRREPSFEKVVKEAITSHAPRGFERTSPANNEVALFITSLDPGGAERQMCYVARELRKRGHQDRVLTYFQPKQESLHYYPLLQDAGVPLHFISQPNSEFRIEDLITTQGLEELHLLQRMPAEFREDVWNLYTHLMVFRPRVLHCWLDHSNVIGAIAGWLAGVPKIILSTRNVNPTFFDYIYKDWYQKWYSMMAQSPRVMLVGNSYAGAKSYAEWMKIRVDRFNVIHNGIDFDVIKAPSERESVDFRRSLGIEETAPVIGGVFRLSAEKRPLFFLKTIAELRQQFPNLHAVVAGVGAMEQEMRQEIASLGLGSCVHLLGRRNDTPLVMSACDMLLLTSSQEGLPNVLMEAQWLERPVVATNAGGVAEVVEHGLGGYVCGIDNMPEVVFACSELLRDRARRREFGAAGKEWVRRRFSIDHMIERTVELYDFQPGVRTAGNSDINDGPFVVHRGLRKTGS